MFYKFATGALAAALLTTAAPFFVSPVFVAPAFAATMVQEVKVAVDATALENNKAAAHWVTLSGDLSAAILKRLPDGISKDGALIDIAIDSLSLANSLQAANGTADSRLIGSVKVSGIGNDPTQIYDLTVSFADASPFFPEGTDLTKITTDSMEYYQAMIDAFADHVVAKLN